MQQIEFESKMRNGKKVNSDITVTLSAQKDKRVNIYFRNDTKRV